MLYTLNHYASVFGAEAQLNIYIFFYLHYMRYLYIKLKKVIFIVMKD